MANFQGTMRIEGDAGPPVRVNARVGDDRLVLEVDGVTVGEWPVTGVHAEVAGGGVALRLGGDNVTIDVSDRAGFVAALEAPVSEKPHRRRRRPSLRSVLSFLFLAGVVAAAVWAPRTAGSVMLLSGLMLEVIGAVAHSEPRVALRLPLNLQALHVILVGMVLVGAGLTLVLVA